MSNLFIVKRGFSKNTLSLLLQKGNPVQIRNSPAAVRPEPGSARLLFRSGPLSILMDGKVGKTDQVRKPVCRICRQEAFPFFGMNQHATPDR